MTHIANHGALVDGDDPLARQLVDEIFGPPTGAEMELVLVDPFTYAGPPPAASGGAMAVFVFELPDRPRRD